VDAFSDPRRYLGVGENRPAAVWKNNQRKNQRKSKMARGGKRPGAGRLKGAKNKRTKRLDPLTIKAVAAIEAAIIKPFLGDTHTFPNGAMNMTEQYPRGTAYHEAGHAVVAWSLNLHVLTVRASDDDASGGADIVGADGLQLIDHIALCSAGTAAEDIFGYPAHNLAGFGDRVKILALLEAEGISEDDGQGKASRDEGYNCALNRLKAHKSNVIRLAERLVERGHVDASEFLQLMAAR
jgi:hypothetical protein